MWLVFQGAVDYLAGSSCGALLGPFASFCCYFSVGLDCDVQPGIFGLRREPGWREWLAGGGGCPGRSSTGSWLSDELG